SLNFEMHIMRSSPVLVRSVMLSIGRAEKYVPVLIALWLGLSAGGTLTRPTRELTALGAEPAATHPSPDLGGGAIKDPKLILVTIDGLRWEEVFRGADERFMNREAGNVRDSEGLKARFWDDDVQERRRRLLP